jgi:hypothetical protein
MLITFLQTLLNLPFDLLGNNKETIGVNVITLVYGPEDRLESSVGYVWDHWFYVNQLEYG